MTVADRQTEKKLCLDINIYGKENPNRFSGCSVAALNSLDYVLDFLKIVVDV